MKITVRQITFTAILAAITAAMGSLRIPLGFANLYLTDVAVCIAGILLNPFFAAVSGGVGAFLGDLIFYPQAMVVSLIVRVVQAAVISVFSHYVMRKKPVISTVIGCIIGALIMAFGYSYFAVLFYSSIEYAASKFPLELLQAAVGVIIAVPLCYKFRLRELLDGYEKNDGSKN